GIRVGDIIVSVDGNRVASTDDLAFFLRRAGPVARLEVIDGRRPLDDSVVRRVRPVDGRIGINATQVRLPAWSSRPDPTPFSAPPGGGGLLHGYRPAAGDPPGADRTRNRRSRLPQQQVHHPAPADVRTVPAGVVEHVGAVAPGVLQGIGQ